MDWIVNLFTTQDSVAHIALLYSLVIAIGCYLGKIKIAGISLGVTFVLFAGILAGHIGFTAPMPVLNFLQDFGLIIFVFMIGLQVGPGFFESFGKAGIRMNLLATIIILLNIGVMFACYFIFFSPSTKNMAMMVGTMYGAVTNTPGLGAASEALHSIMGQNIPLIANGYACAYPLGVLGIIGATLLIKYVCHIDIKKENEELNAKEAQDPHAVPHPMHLKVSNSYIAGRTLQQISNFLNRDVVITRIRHEGILSVPKRDTVFKKGDEILVVCAESDAEPVKAFIGPEFDADWKNELNEQQKMMVSKRIIVTNPSMNGKCLGKMHLSSLYGVNITRITRQGMDLFASRSHHFHVGDRVMVVGPEENVDRVAELMGNSEKKLNVPNIATIFVGIIVGILFGSLPIAIPGMPVPLKLGLAGGPLIIAILLGRYGYRMGLVTYITTSANLMLREFGLVLFLASVGIKAGAGFWITVVKGDGLLYVLTGFLITVIPILIIGIIARKIFKFNYFTIMGMLAGSYTDPPALAYANSVCNGEAPALGYSTVYPLSMFLRIFFAQMIILFCCA